MTLSKLHRKTCSKNYGFTLIEIIATLLLISIMAGIAVNKSGDISSGNHVIVELELFKNHLRYAQIKSMNSTPTDIWQISIAVGGASYTLQQYSATATAWQNKNLPNKTSATHTFPNGITVTSGTTNVIFNNHGVPVTTDRVTLLNSNLTVTIGDGTSSESLTVTKKTGFMP